MNATHITPAAQQWLATTTSARVLSAFDRACNLVNQDNEILAIVTHARGLNPFALVVASETESPFTGMPPTSSIKWGAGFVELGHHFIALDSARVWNPIPPWDAINQFVTAHPTAIDALVQPAPAGSLLELYTGGTSPLLTRAREGARLLLQGDLSGAKLLAGAGGGLTPAGDDFMVGMCLAWWALGESHKCAGLAELVTPLTTMLSAAYVRAATRGECMALWHDVFSAWQRGESPLPSLQALLSIGHTSGADAVAGFVAHRLII